MKRKKIIKGVLGIGLITAVGVVSSSPELNKVQHKVTKAKIVRSFNSDQNNPLKQKSAYQLSALVKKKNKQKDSWSWPFPYQGEKFDVEQKFGHSEFRHGKFHDGLDFGKLNYPGKEFSAVKGGKVVFSGKPQINGLSSVVIVVNDGKWNFVYREFGSSEECLLVKKGEYVSAGQVIGIRNTSILHIGVTEKEWTEALNSSFKNDDVWKDPLPLIKRGVEESKKGKTEESGSVPT